MNKSRAKVAKIQRINDSIDSAIKQFYKVEKPFFEYIIHETEIRNAAIRAANRYGPHTSQSSNNISNINMALTVTSESSWYDAIYAGDTEQEEKEFVFEVLESLMDLPIKTAEYLITHFYLRLVRFDFVSFDGGTNFYFHPQEEIHKYILKLSHFIRFYENIGYFSFNEIYMASSVIETSYILPLVRERWHSLFVTLGITHRTVQLNNQLQVIL